LISVSVMEDKGFSMEFKNQQVLIRPKEFILDTAQVIGVRKGELYRLQGEPVRVLVYDNDSLCKLWHERMAHLHHRALSILKQIVIGLPEFSIEQHGVCKGCMLGKHAKATFPSSKHRSKEILEPMTEDEKEILKVERSPVIFKEVQQPSGGKGETVFPCTCVKRPRWFTQTLKDDQEHVETPRSTVKESVPLKKFLNYMALMSSILDSKPSSFQDETDPQVWQDAMVKEYTSIMKNGVWDIVPRPKRKSIVISRWLYKIKHVANGNIKKFKARFVARGFSRREGVDYKETFALVSRYTSIRAVVFFVSFMGWRIHQMDVKTTFLNGIIEEEVYIEQP
jgi:hypothetical protein